MIKIYYIPLIGALALASFSILERALFKKHKLNIKTFLSASFLAIVLIMLPFAYFFFDLKPQAFELTNILIFLSVIALSMIANLFYIYSIKWEKISNIEPARMLEPLFVIVLAIIFSYIFGEALFERNPKVITSALVAGAALVFSHVRKHHLEFNKYFLAAIAGSFFFAIELVISRLILDYYSPLTFYFLRGAGVLFLGLILLRPKFSKLNNKIRYKILGIAVLWVVYRVVVYYGFIHLGVIFTTLMIMLGPVFIYFFAWKFLKEKLDKRNLVSAGIIVAAVLYAVLG